jgi:hypothetical protein
MPPVPPNGLKTQQQLPGTLFWQDPDSADPDVCFRFFVPHGARVTMTAPLAGFLLRREQKPPDLRCERTPDGWSVTVVVGLSKLYLSTRALRIPTSSKWRAAVGRLLDRPLRGLVRVRLSLEEDGGWESTAGTDPASRPISVKPHPPEQHFNQHFPIRVVLPGNCTGPRAM